MIKEKGKYKDNKVYKHLYNDIEDLLNTLRNSKVNNIFKDKDEQASHNYDEDFNDFRTYEEAEKALEFGFDKYFKDFMTNVEKAKNIISKIEEPKSGSQKNDVIGYMPIVPNAILGIPQNMINSNMTKKKIPRAKIFIEFSEACGVSSKNIIKYKTVIFALIDLMERKGIRCEVWIVENSKKYDEICSYCIKLKDFFQPINFYKLQFPICSSDMLRRINFRMVETHPDIKNSWDCGYGQPLICYAEDEPGVDEDNEFQVIEKIKEIIGLNEEDIYIPGTRLIDHDDNIEEIIKKLLTKTDLKNYIKFNGGNTNE